ncbi:MFS transporter [Pseudomaricurvus alkylphenolicus]|uniref:MFS transporter n=1 Tax=Pseudomaricurvus alkylphenolicus TaxID=1306991 RepID=UPI00141F1581|nr:MFS transporter [Pseudomaricurvus alkylphenolicus]
MTQSSSPHPATEMINKPSTVFSAATLLAIAYLIYNMLPLILGSAADSLGLNEKQIGYLGSIYMAGSTLSNISAVFWVRRLDWRKVVFLTTLISASIYAIAGHLEYNSLLVTFFLLGVTNASIVSCVLTCLGDTDNPDQSFGYGIGIQVTLAGIGACLLPIFVVPEWGFQGVMFALAGVAIASMLLIPRLPKNDAKGAERLPVANVTKGTGSNGAVCWGISGMMLYFIGQSGVWAFLERIGIQGGITSGELGAIFGITLVLSAAGAFLASAIGTRFGRCWPIIGATVACVASLYLLPICKTPWSFGTAVFFYAAAWNFVLPFQMTIITEGDSRGRFTPLIPACQLLGSAIGPALAGNLIIDGSYAYVYLLAAVTAIISTVIFIATELYLTRRSSDLKAVPLSSS